MKDKVAASLAVIFVFLNSITAKSKIAKQSQVKSANEDDGTVNPPRDIFFKNLLCKKLTSLSPFNFYGHVWYSDIFDNFLGIYQASVVPASAPALSKLYSTILLLFSSKLLLSTLNKFCFSPSTVSLSAVRPSF